MKIFDRVKHWFGWGSVAGASSRRTTAGITVNQAKLFTLPAVLNGIQVLSETFAQLPLDLFERTSEDGDRQRATDDRIYRLVKRRPNPRTTAFTWRQTMMAQALAWGAGYSWLERGPGGTVVAIWNCSPGGVTPRDVNETGEILYDVRLPSMAEIKNDVPSRDLLILRAMSLDGETGLDLVSTGGESVGLSLSAQQFGATFFGNGARPSGVLTTDKSLNKTQATEIGTAFKQATGGSRTNETAVLGLGTSYQSVGVQPDQAQFLETRQFQVVEAARLLNLPPHMVKDLQRATFSNIEQSSIEFVTYTMGPWLTRWEQELDVKLIEKANVDKQFFEHNLTALLKGATLDRFKAYAQARQWGWLSVNDIRKLENMPPIGDEGDVYLSPMNMTPGDEIDDGDDNKVDVDTSAGNLSAVS